MGMIIWIMVMKVDKKISESRKKIDKSIQRALDLSENTKDALNIFIYVQLRLIDMFGYLGMDKKQIFDMIESSYNRWNED